MSVKDETKGARGSARLSSFVPRWPINVRENEATRGRFAVFIN